MIGWATPRDVAMWVGRPERTIWTWYQRGRIPSMRHPKTGRLLVDAHAADKLAGQGDTPPNRRRAA